MTTIRISDETKKKLEELRVSSDTYPDTSTRPSMEAVIKKLLNKEK